MSMIREQVRASAVAVLALALLVAGLAPAVRVVAAGPRSEVAKDPGPTSQAEPVVRSPVPAKTPEAEAWNLTLREAITIGLDNADAIRVVTLARNGEPLEIAPVDRLDRPSFNANVMALLRSIEQQYWGLTQQQLQQWGCEKAVELGREILKREQAELQVGRGTIADVAEAEQRLEQFSFELAAKSRDLETAEGQLRKVLGLPPADGRWIVAVTQLTEAKLEPYWNDCLAVMRKNHPDVVKAAAWLKQAAADSSEDRPERVRRHKALLDQVTYQTTHTLARCFLELDANYKQFKTASRLRAEAAQKLEAQRASYESGRIPVDHYLHAVKQYATGLAHEAEFKRMYNVSISALEEAKGTLLEHDMIRMVAPADRVAPPTEAELYRLEHPVPVVPASHPTSPLLGPFPPPPSVPASPTPTASVTPEPAPHRLPSGPVERESREKVEGGKTVSFDFTIGAGASPIRVRGSFTVTPIGAR